MTMLMIAKGRRPFAALCCHNSSPSNGFLPGAAAAAAGDQESPPIPRIPYSGNMQHYKQQLLALLHGQQASTAAAAEAEGEVDAPALTAEEAAQVSWGFGLPGGGAVHMQHAQCACLPTHPVSLVGLFCLKTR